MTRDKITLAQLESFLFKAADILRGKMDALIKQFGMLRQSWDKVTARIDQMQSETVNMVEFLNSVYGEPSSDQGRGLTIHKNRTEAIFTRLHNERIASGRPTMKNDWTVSKWEAFNAVQGYVQHSATRRGGEHGAFARAIFALNDPVVVKAENLLLGQQFALAA